jgi:hypothetical protein
MGDMFTSVGITLADIYGKEKLKNGLEKRDAERRRNKGKGIRTMEETIRSFTIFIIFPPPC